MISIQTFFPSYQEALSHCRDGYHDDHLTELVALKTKNIASNMTQTLLDPDPIAITALAIARARLQRDHLRILDIGGACGYAFFATKALLGNIQLTWCVVETETMVKSACRHIQSDGLSFCSSIDDALRILGGCDVIHSSSTIQYVPEPLSLMQRMGQIPADFLIITRFPLYDGPHAIGLQTSMLSENGPGPAPAGLVDRQIHYPVTFCNKADVERNLLPGYEIAGQFSSPGSNHMVGNMPAIGTSFILKRRG